MRQRPLDFCETLYYARNLDLGNHSAIFYRSPNEKREMTFNFLQAGLERGEGAVYIASQETSKQIRRGMRKFGLDINALEKDGALQIFDYDGWYITDGEVNVPHIVTMGSRVLDEAKAIGLKGLRGCGETACFFQHGKEKELVEYERMVGRRFDLPVATMCAYDVNHAKSLDANSFFSLIHAHGPLFTHSFAQEVKLEDFLPPIIDDVLKAIFTDVGKKAILRILNERLSLAPDMITEHPRIIFEGLEEILGSGAEAVAKSIVAKMHEKIGMTASR